MGISSLVFNGAITIPTLYIIIILLLVLATYYDMVSLSLYHILVLARFIYFLNCVASYNYGCPNCDDHILHL